MEGWKNDRQDEIKGTASRSIAASERWRCLFLHQTDHSEKRKENAQRSNSSFPSAFVPSTFISFTPPIPPHELDFLSFFLYILHSNSHPHSLHFPGPTNQTIESSNARTMATLRAMLQLRPGSSPDMNQPYTLCSTSVPMTNNSTNPSPGHSTAKQLQAAAVIASKRPTTTAHSQNLGLHSGAASGNLGKCLCFIYSFFLFFF